MKKYSIAIVVILVVAVIVSVNYFKEQDKKAAQEIHFKAVPIPPESSYKNPKF